MPTRPNFLFIGPDKSGSTWIHEVLSWHPQVFMSRAKELFFFDQYFHLGTDWYFHHFQGARPEHRIVGEVSHDYLYSVEAAERIATLLPDVRLMACLREPVDRAFSSYLYMLKQGRLRCSFDEAIRDVAELVDHGRYAKHLAAYLERFERNAIQVSYFDDLVRDSNAFARDMFAFLGIDGLDLPRELCLPVNKAVAPRSFLLARLARQFGVAVRRRGRPRVVTTVKSSRLVQRLLYRDFNKDEKPRLSTERRDELKHAFRDDVEQLSELLRDDVAARWGYAASCDRSRLPLAV